MHPAPVLIALAAAGLLTARTVQAAPGVDVAIDCPAIDSEQRAAVEARVRADLLVKHLPTGQLTVRCTDQELAASWQPVDGPAATMTAPVRADLQLSDQLVDISDRATSAAPAEPSPTPVASPPPPPRRSPVRPETTPPVVRRNPELRAAWRPTAFVGVASNVWFDEFNVAIGPRLGIGAELGDELRLAATGAYAWAIHPPEGLRVAEGALSLEASLRVWRGVWVGGGAGLSLLALSGPGPRAAGSDGMALPLLSLHARYLAAIAMGSLSIGPGVSLYPARREVRVSGQTLCTVPIATPSLTLEWQLL